VNIPVGEAAVFVEEDETLEVLLVATVVPDVIEVPGTAEAVEEEDWITLLLEPVQLPGMHCEYQSLEYLQQDPEAQVIDAVQPIPPPVIVISSYEIMRQAENLHWPQADCWAEMPEIRASTKTTTLISPARLTSIPEKFK
jgi:hypothetical protein